MGDMQKLILIDGAGLVYRSFFAVPLHLRSATGEHTNAILGFTNILLNIILRQKPDYIAVAFDKKGPTFRHKEFKEYKATRVKAPQELYDQIPRVKEVISAFRIPLFEVDGFEADDVLATVAKHVSKEKNLETYIATGDFDMFQTISPRVKILYPTQGFKEASIVDEKQVMEKYGLTPAQIPDYKGLCGDHSDNIPGVMGIGEKTAKILLQKYGSLENIYEKLTGVIPEGIRKKLEIGRESAFFSKKLATLIYEVPFDFSLKNCELHSPNPDKIVPLFEKLGFYKLLSQMGLAGGRKQVKIPENQASLF